MFYERRCANYSSMISSNLRHCHTNPYPSFRLPLHVTVPGKNLKSIKILLGPKQQKKPLRGRKTLVMQGILLILPCLVDPITSLYDVVSYWAGSFDRNWRT
jgi:hypothetical protein